MKLILVTGMIFVIVSGCGVAKSKVCTRQQAIEAETEASKLSSWRAILESYNKYLQCDDGAIAEGYSFSVAAILADRWDEISELAELTEGNRPFRDFVLRHVDETMKGEQNKKIIYNAKNRCPKGAEELCQDIYLKALK